MRGQGQAQAEQEHAQALKDSKLRQQVLKHQIDAIKLDDALRAEDLTKRRAELMIGQEAANTPASGIPAGAAAMIRGQQAAVPGTPVPRMAPSQVGALKGVFLQRSLENLSAAPDAAAEPASANASPTAANAEGRGAAPSATDPASGNSPPAGRIVGPTDDTAHAPLVLHQDDTLPATHAELADGTLPSSFGAPDQEPMKHAGHVWLPPIKIPEVGVDVPGMWYSAKAAAAEQSARAIALKRAEQPLHNVGPEESAIDGAGNVVYTNPNAKTKPLPDQYAEAVARRDAAKAAGDNAAAARFDAAATRTLDAIKATKAAGETSEFGAFQQIYAEGLGKDSFAELNAKEKGGVIPAFTKAKQDPEMRALIITARQAAVDRAKGVTTAEGDFTKTGDDFLATIPIQWRKTVEKIARYEEDPTKVASMRGGMRETLSQWVNQVNPAYKADEFSVRAPTRKAFTTGTQGQQITAINTAIGHLDQLAPIVARLDNSSFTPGNEVTNRLRTIFGSSKVTNFDTLKDALAGEIASVLSKGSATVSGIAAEKEKIHAASSPEQLLDYVRTQIPIMGSKLAGLDYAFHQAMGEDDTYSALSPSSKKILAKYGFDPAEHGAASTTAAPAALPERKLTDGQIEITDPAGGKHLFSTQAKADRFKSDVKAATAAGVK